MPTRAILLLAAALIGPVGGARSAAAQETLERTLNLSGGWVGPTGLLQINLPYRFMTERDVSGIHGVPTFELGMAAPGSALLGARFAPGSPTVPDDSDEWEVFGRFQPLAQARGARLDLGAGVAYNGAAGSVDGELSAGRWLGPARFLTAGRLMSAPYGSSDLRFAVAGGGVVHPLPRRAPLALAADVATLLDREAGERIAWSAAIQLGISFTTHSLSLFATNTATSTLQGISRGQDRVRYGFEFTASIPVGRFLGWYVPREEAMESVAVDTPPVDGVYLAEARNFLFLPKRIVVPAGTTIEWTNNDEVVHTVTAADGSWDSGGIRPGERWRARFEEPGRYPFLCSPHPFMQGVVIVR